MLNKDKPEESNLRQQSENPYSTAKCKGNIPWIPRLEMPKDTDQKVRNQIINSSVIINIFLCAFLLSIALEIIIIE